VLTSIALEPIKKDQSIGRSTGRSSTKIHATIDALGNPTGFTLSLGSTHDLQGAEVPLVQIAVDTLIADRAFDVHEQVIDWLQRNGKSAVIPSKSNRKIKRLYDRELYKAQHLIENFFCKLKQYRACNSL
jgi:transposase